MEKIKAYATEDGTKRYTEKYAAKHHETFYRQAQGLWVSTIGIGSYLGDPTDAVDDQYAESVRRSILSGINLLDTAINYRCQRSERIFGKVIRELIGSGEVRRDELVICTKGGFLPFEESYPPSAQTYFDETFIQTGILNAEDIAEGCHAMTPNYLDHQLTRSLDNLGIETLDVYYLHNPETQLKIKERKPFLDSLVQSFKWAEEKVKEGKIKHYGIATWNGLRVGYDHGEYLSLEEIQLSARQAGGKDHHFKYVQLPVNLAMPEAWVLPNQGYGGGALNLLKVAERLEMSVVGSASLLQAQLIGPFPPGLSEKFESLETAAQKCLQFSRSVPGVTAALVGMKNAVHLEENLKVGAVKTLTEDELVKMFQ